MSDGAAGLLWYEGPAALLRSGLGGPWERAVALGAVGRYAEARALLEPLGTSLALSTLASHARQVGLHAAAEELDAAALDTAGDDPSARADATSGLVADALGRGDAELAQSRVRPAFAAVFDWRSGVRYHWVVAELALLVGDARTAAAEADEGLRVARWATVPRHVTKSLLVRGVARQVARGDGADDLLAALAAARELGLPTLVWPAAQVAAEAVPDRAPGLRALAAEAVGEVARGLGDRGGAFRARPDIAALLAGG